ncbi:MAG: hypothetical protein ACTSR2_08120 [Candidatus Hodarchaeales archaeon]
MDHQKHCNQLVELKKGVIATTNVSIIADGSQIATTELYFFLTRD